MSFNNTRDAIDGTLKSLGAVKIMLLYPANSQCTVVYYEHRTNKCCFIIQNVEWKQPEANIVEMIRSRFEYATYPTGYNNAETCLNVGEQKCQERNLTIS